MVMTAQTIATDTYRLSHLIKAEEWVNHGWCRGIVTVNGPAATLRIGAVLGKVTATGKYKFAIETAVDGSKVADAIVIEDTVIPATTDTAVQVLIRGDAIVGKNALILDATYDNDAKKLAVYDALEAKRILVNTQI